MADSHDLNDLFGAARGLIGMLHVEALPGTPRAGLPVEAIAEKALAEAEVYRRAGFNGLMIENMHDRPYLKGRVGPEVVAAMTVVAREVRRDSGLPLGVQVLAGANREAVAVAHAAGAQFARVEGFVFAHVADEGLIEGSAGGLLRYRRAIGAEAVLLFADIKKKHSAHAITADVDLAETAHAAELFLADGLVVTGAATGRAAAAEDVRVVADAVDLPILVGSGITPDNLHDYSAADAFIVGSSVKRAGLWSEPIDPDRCAALAEAFSRLP